MVDVTENLCLPSGSTGLVRKGSRAAGTRLNGASSRTKIKDVLDLQDKMLGKPTLTPEELKQFMEGTIRLMGDATIDGLQRINLMKRFRRLLATPQFDAVASYLKYLMRPLEASCKDGRTPVRKEACITISYIAQRMEARSTDFIIRILDAVLVALAKDDPECRIIVIIFEAIQTGRLLPVLLRQMQSKSKEVRRVVCHAIRVVFEWPKALVQQRSHAMTEIIKMGLTDADSEVRQLMRMSYTTSFETFFPAEAHLILTALTEKQQRQLRSTT